MKTTEIRKFVCTVLSLAMLMNTCAPMAVLAEGETEKRSRDHGDD